MAKIDRLGWAAGSVFTAYGLRIGIRASGQEALDELVPRLPPGSQPASGTTVDILYSVIRAGKDARKGVRPYNLLYADATRLARTLADGEIADAFEAGVQLHVAEFARRRVFVHAGVVGWQGQAIVIPGRSFSGKTTLVQALVRRGAVYYSDEYAVLDGRGRVHPFARPLQIRPPDNGKALRVCVEALGGTRGTQALPVGLVVVSHYKPGARWRPRSLSLGRGLLDLLGNAVAARRQPGLVLSTLSKVAKRARFLKGTRGEAPEVAKRLLENF